MSDGAAIRTPVNAETRRTLERLARDRGLSPEEVAGEMVAAIATDEAELIAALDDGRAQIARGEYMTHEDFVAAIAAYKRNRRRAA